jgi:serine/threonine-protein kinase
VPVKRSISPWVWLFGVLAVLAVLGGIALAVGGAGTLFGPPPVDVPNVVGKSSTAAATTLTAAGLAAGALTTATSDSVPIGAVIAQSPPPGMQVRRGSKVALVISAGPAMAVIPDLGGLTEADALRAIQDRGFTIGPIGRKDSRTIPQDKVISQEPKHGTVAKKGSIVSFTISTGKPMGTVPDVVGRSKRTAVTKAEDAGFRVDVVNQFSDSVSAGLVIGTNPPGGTKAERGSTVTIAVSKGPQSFPIPGDVIGKTEAAATTQLQALGLIVTASTSPSSTTPGQVITTDPVPGTIVKSGSTVKIVVGAP